MKWWCSQNINFSFTNSSADTINTVKEKAEAKANLVKQSLENSKDFAEEVLDSTGTLATEKFKKGEKFVKDIIEAKTQVRLK